MLMRVAKEIRLTANLTASSTKCYLSRTPSLRLTLKLTRYSRQTFHLTRISVF